jgi:hypothetical protein
MDLAPRHFCCEPTGPFLRSKRMDRGNSSCLVVPRIHYRIACPSWKSFDMGTKEGMASMNGFSAEKVECQQIGGLNSESLRASP